MSIGLDLSFMDSHALVSEIQQLISQYDTEVGSRRKPWPESIRSRVHRLFAMGLKGSEISRQTGIPYFSILRIKKCGFRELTVTVPARGSGGPRKAATLAVSKEVATVTVSTPDGYVLTIEGALAAVQIGQAVRVTGGCDVL